MKVLSYTTIDKSEWGPGPWQREPDKLQWVDEETGLPCLVKRNSLGALCGYVGVPPGHPFFERKHSMPGVEVHGGLTYAARCQDGPEAEAICHVPEPGEPDDVWWLGFDCAHSGDLVPGMKPFFGDTYRDLDYVRAQVGMLARRLAEAARP